ncbi:MAG: hypothetical protein FWE10_04025 [Rikenellaceae bacterium]|nr:hypothetical protein [Rikenellaceae bacterium]MCL2692895.1 hypothetical protein [Rikenellaceae bacterium]
MKKYFPITCALLALLLILSSCNTRHDANEASVNDDDAFSISQARDYYETLVTTRSQRFVEQYLCVSFTPLWDEARYSRAQNIESVDVPIEKSTHFIIEKDKNFVKAPQRLTIIKDSYTGIASSFLTTFIPDAKFMNSTNTDEYDPQAFETSGNKNNYSGLVIYTPTDSSEIVLVNVYKDGRKVDSANIFAADAASRKQGSNKILKLLSGVYVYPYDGSVELASSK